jgi:hypothetical protein
MAKLRSTLIVLGVSAALLLPMSSVFARGGGRGGGGGGGGRGGGGGGMGGGGRGGGGGGGGGNGGGGGAAAAAPTENPTITADRAQITSNTTALTTATNAYSKAETDFRVKYMKQPDYADAQKAVDDASKALDAARAVVIAKLKSTSSEYKAALAKDTELQKKLTQIRATGGNRDAISATSTDIMNNGDNESKIEKTALDADPGYQEAKKKLDEATATLNAQKDAMKQAIDADTTLAGLKTTKDAAQKQLTDSQAKLAQDRVASGG